MTREACLPVWVIEQGDEVSTGFVCKAQGGRSPGLQVRENSVSRLNPRGWNAKSPLVPYGSSGLLI